MYWILWWLKYISFLTSLTFLNNLKWYFSSLPDQLEETEIAKTSICFSIIPSSKDPYTKAFELCIVIWYHTTFDFVTSAHFGSRQIFAYDIPIWISIAEFIVVGNNLVANRYSSYIAYDNEWNRKSEKYNPLLSTQIYSKVTLKECGFSESAFNMQCYVWYKDTLPHCLFLQFIITFIPEIV